MSDGDARSSAASTLVLVTVLSLGAAAAWRIGHEAPLRVDSASLETLPRALGDWRARDIPMDPAVEKILGADGHVQRAYRDAGGHLLWLYVGYYGSARGGRSDHTPALCYPAAGWHIRTGATRRVRWPGGAEVQEMRVERDGEQRLVHFWSHSPRSGPVLGDWAGAWDRLVRRVATGRADGAFVRLSSPVADDAVAAVRARLVAFGSAFDAELSTHWPRELRRQDEGAREGRESLALD